MPGYIPHGGRPLEELLRIIWKRNPMIHIILINFPFVKNIFTLYYPPRCDGLDDNEHWQLARHYQVTSVKWKHVVCSDNMTKEEQGKLAGKYIADDGNHPSALIHLHVAEFIIQYLKNSFRHLAERLQLARGTTYVRGMMMTDEMTIKEFTIQYIDKKQPVFNTTWIDGSDCFVSFERPFGDNLKLTYAIRNTSKDFNIDNAFTIKFYTRNSVQYPDNLHLFILENKGSFVNFRLEGFKKTSSCSHGFKSRLAIAYTLVKDVDPGQVLIKLNLYLDNGEILREVYNVTVQSYGYKTNYVHTMPYIKAPTGTDFCGADQTTVSTPLIVSADVHIELLTETYPLLLHAIVIAYDCCHPVSSLSPSLI